MRGHLPLLRMRRQGAVPSSAWVTVDGEDGAWIDWPAWTSMAQMHVEPGEPIATLDLRCLVGMLVFVDGEDETRVAAFADAALEAGAKRVLSAVQRRRGAEFETVKWTDSKGGVTWPG